MESLVIRAAGLLAAGVVDAHMDRSAFAARIDHTVLGPETTPADVERVVSEAAEWGMNACVPPCYVAECNEATERASGEAASHAAECNEATEQRDVTLVTVVGFPHGQHAPAVKRAEAERAVADGADELDVVVNVGRLRAGEDDAAREDLAGVVAASDVPVKVIVEAPLLSDDEKRAAGRLAREAGADYLKTATGFAGGGATVADVELLAEFLPVKASGGIGDYETARAMLDAGAVRIGASAGVDLVRGHPDA